jgi:hypothetical protein
VPALPDAVNSPLLFATPASPAAQAPPVVKSYQPVVAALFVLEDGPYCLPGVDLWGVKRDARRYAGPYPVVAHPPCERWGSYWSGGPAWKGPRKQLGDDGGCFASALECVRAYGGVLEHPKGSKAWQAYGLQQPPHSGGWIDAGDDYAGITCCVEQGNYGHTARKASWLYSTRDPVPLLWGAAPITNTVGKARGVCERLSSRQRKLTPEPFRDLLICLALGVL